MHDKTLKLPQYFYLLMGKCLGHYFPVRPAYYQAAQCNQKTPISVSSRWQGRSEKAKKGKASTLITATTSVHLPKSVSTDLTKKSLLPSSVYLLSSNTVQSQNTYFCILKVTGQVWESQKRININTNHSYNRCSSPLVSLNRSNKKFRFSFNHPNKKRWGTWLVDDANLLIPASFKLFQPTLIETSFSIWPQLLSQGILSLFYLPSSRVEERHTTLGKIWFHLINQTSIS